MTNCSELDVGVTVGPLNGTDPLLFASIPAAGTAIALRSKETTSVTVQYSPLVASPAPSLAYFSIQQCSSGAGCMPLVALRGQAVASGLLVDPTSLDFDVGFVPPGRAVPEFRFVTLSNLADPPIHLTADPVVVNEPDLGSPEPFQLGAGFPTRDTVIPPGASIQIPVVFLRTSSALRFSGELDLSTDDPANFSIKIPLTAESWSGAVILCSPLGLDFGLNAVGSTSTLSVLCTNIGQDVPGHPEANLFLPDPNSIDQALVVQNGDAAFQPAFDQPFPASGLAAGQSTKINVTYAPTLPATDSDTLIISSNDSVNPHVSITLAGTGRVPPSCGFQFGPTGLDFRHVDKGNVSTTVVEIANSGSDGCIVSSAQMAAGSSPAFSVTITPGTNGPSSQALQVTFAPTVAGATFQGTIDISINNPNNPQQTLAVSGSS